MHQQIKKMEVVKEEFYNLLEHNTDQLPNSDIKIFVDFDAKVGKEDIQKHTTGNESLHNETNKNNGIKIITFVISKILM